MDLIPSNEYVEFEDRVYNNPQVGIDETNTFIDQLRATQGQQNQQILSDTQALGTDVPSNLGGLTGGESYFTSRYQTAPTVSATQNLRTAAQAAALNDVLANEQAIWKKRYNDAYRAYQKRQNNGDNPAPDATEGKVDEEDSGTKVSKVEENVYTPVDAGGKPAKSVAWNGTAHKDWSGQFREYKVTWEDGSTSVGYIGNDNNWYWTDGKYDQKYNQNMIDNMVNRLKYGPSSSDYDPNRIY